MTGPRSYGDPCGVARALDVIGERWALLIVRELIYGPKRFSDLRAALGLSPNVLSQRLAELETSGVLAQRTSGAALYELTAWGRDLRPVLLQLGRWGARSPHPVPGDLSADSLMLALEATFAPAKAADLAACVELELGNERFTAAVRAGKLSINRGNAVDPVVVIATDSATLRALAFGDLKLGAAPAEVRGDARVARAFFKLFDRPL